ncbi:MAG: tRNA pseudouridine(38-40) synthase TruA [Acidimicrobiales bacterium]
MPPWPASNWSDPSALVTDPLVTDPLVTNPLVTNPLAADPLDPAPELPPGPIRLLVAYDGSGFRGYAPQPGTRTVGGVLADAVALRLGSPVDLAVAGRTDAGVHAWGQVVSFDPGPGRPIDLMGLARSLNRQLNPAIVIREAAWAPPGFHARHSARGRHYRYQILCRPVADPFLAPTSWHLAEVLDTSAMEAAAAVFVGEHDFSSFCRAPRGVTPVPSLVRRVLSATWSPLPDDRLRLDISARAFCHQMVRALVGAMVTVGRRRHSVEDLVTMLGARDRATTPDLAPAHGLCLWAVDYG